MSDCDSQDRGTERAGARRPWMRLLLVTLVGFGCIALFGPHLLLGTRFRCFILRTLVPQCAGQLEIGTITTGWRSPVVMRGIRYRDERVELNIARATCDRTLTDLLLHPHDWGRTELESVQFVFRNTPRPEAVPAPIDAVVPIVTAAARNVSTATKEVRWPAIEVVGTNGTIAVQALDGQLTTITSQFDFQLRTAGTAAHLNLLARMDSSTTDSHVSARGTFDWPFRSAGASLSDLRLDMVRLDTARLDPLFSVARVPLSTSCSREAPLRIHGMVTGSASLRGDGNRSIVTDLNVEIHDCELSGPIDGWLLREPTVKVSGVGRAGSGSLQLDSVQIMSDALAVAAAGRVRDCFGDAVADLHGTARCDWEKLGLRLRPFLHEDVSLTGLTRRPWRLRGPLSAATVPELIEKLQIDVATAWDALKILDFQAGPIELSAHGYGGNVAFDPLTATFQNGQIAIEPVIRFRSQAPVLCVSPGRVLRDVTVDPALCEWILRYVDPLATVSGDLRGRLTLDLDELEIPLVPNGLDQAVIQGRITLDDAEFSPNHSLREILALTGIEIPENLRTSQTIAIRLEDGRVYHSGLAIPMRDYQVTLDGWVALDRSMQIRLSLPVTEQMLGRDKRLYRLLRSQRVDVPITGTLENPKVSEDALSRNIQRLIHTTLRENFMSEDALRGLLRRAIK